ncbi:MAG: hypothetical protein MSH18_02745 [Bacteroidales bacterium]|nr:hypothetical protein [Bacteroidales bacterium]
MKLFCTFDFPNGPHNRQNLYHCGKKEQTYLCNFQRQGVRYTPCDFHIVLYPFDPASTPAKLPPPRVVAGRLCAFVTEHNDSRATHFTTSYYSR